MKKQRATNDAVEITVTFNFKTAGTLYARLILKCAIAVKYNEVDRGFAASSIYVFFNCEPRDKCSSF